MRVFVRYDQKDEKGQTRRERNAAFGRDSPVLNVPMIGRYLWDWYLDLSAGLRRVRDGICEPIPHTEFQAWKVNTGNIVYPVEHGILRAMDEAFVAETNKELSAFREREQDRREQEAKARKR